MRIVILSEHRESKDLSLLSDEDSHSEGSAASRRISVYYPTSIVILSAPASRGASAASRRICFFCLVLFQMSGLTAFRTAVSFFLTLQTCNLPTFLLSGRGVAYPLRFCFLQRVGTSSLSFLKPLTTIQPTCDPQRSLGWPILREFDFCEGWGCFSLASPLLGGLPFALLFLAKGGQLFSFVS